MVLLSTELGRLIRTSVGDFSRRNLARIHVDQTLGLKVLLWCIYLLTISTAINISGYLCR